MTMVLVPLMATLGPLALLLLVAVVFAETGLLVGFFLPGDSLLFAAGLFAATAVLPLPVAVVIGATAAAAVVGDQVAFTVGRHGGRRIGRSVRPWTRRMDRHLVAAARFFERHGSKAVVLARFLPLARTFTPVVAGAAGMPRRRFATYNVLGAVLWTVAMVLAGYFLGAVPLVAHHIELVTVGLVTTSLVPAVVVGLRRRLGSQVPVSDAAGTPRTAPREPQDAALTR